MKIKPCPFCESENVDIYGTTIDYKGFLVDGLSVHCDACGARGPVRNLKTRAKREWNDLCINLSFVERMKENA